MEEDSINKEIIRLLEMARTNLIEMDILFNNGLFYGSVNRGYYAIVLQIRILFFVQKFLPQRHKDTELSNKFYIPMYRD